MVEHTNESVIRDWEGLGEKALAAFGPEGDFARQHLLNPAIFALLGPISGKQILDAGCGNGYLSRLLARRGAVVTGVEPAGPLFRAAVAEEEREPLGIVYLQQDLCSIEAQEPRFNVVVANMVLMDIPEYEAAINTCVSMLRDGGLLVFSLAHPCFEERGTGFNEHGFIKVKDYFTQRAISQGRTPLFHRPLSAYVHALCDAGCSITGMIEPQLSQEIIARYPQYRRDRYVPSYVVIRALNNL